VSKDFALLTFNSLEFEPDACGGGKSGEMIHRVDQARQSSMVIRTKPNLSFNWIAGHFHALFLFGGVSLVLIMFSLSLCSNLMLATEPGSEAIAWYPSFGFRQ
jgi:hypothetical protein